MILFVTVMSTMCFLFTSNYRYSQNIILVSLAPFAVNR